MTERQDLTKDEPSSVVAEELMASDASGEATTGEEFAAGDEIAVAAAVGLQSKTDEDSDRRGVYAGWAFLTLLFAIFLALVFWAYSLDDGPDTEAPPSTTVVVESALTPTSLLLTVADDGSVVLSGSVPDEGARRQMVEAAVGLYGDGKVTDNLVIDELTTLAGGTINTSGTAPHADLNIGSLVNAAKQLGLVEGSLDASFSDLVLTPVSATAALATNTVTLSGAFPEQVSIDIFTATASDIFGAENVDNSAAFVDSSTTMQGATILVLGRLDAGDARGQGMMSAFGDSFPGAVIDGAGLEVDTSPEALGRLEAKLREAVVANPILFESGSDNIDEASDVILEQLAIAINAAPGIPVEIVGHTDDQGGEDLNQQLSQDRAIAVLDRLVELGVDVTRLKARGAGEADPVADNDTEEGRAANRRIAFEFEGAAG